MIKLLIFLPHLLLQRPSLPKAKLLKPILERRLNVALLPNHGIPPRHDLALLQRCDGLLDSVLEVADRPVVGDVLGRLECAFFFVVVGLREVLFRPGNDARELRVVARMPADADGVGYGAVAAVEGEVEAVLLGWLAELKKRAEGRRTRTYLKSSSSLQARARLCEQYPTKPVHPSAKPLNQHSTHSLSPGSQSCTSPSNFLPSVATNGESGKFLLTPVFTNMGTAIVVSTGSSTVGTLSSWIDQFLLRVVSLRSVEVGNSSSSTPAKTGEADPEREREEGREEGECGRGGRKASIWPVSVAGKNAGGCLETAMQWTEVKIGEGRGCLDAEQL